MRAVGLLLILSGLLASAGCSSGATADASAVKDPPIPVVATLVQRRAVPVTITAIGTVQSTGNVKVQPRVDGQIVKVFVHDGQEVKAGQPLIQIDPAPYEIKLRLAQAALAGDEARAENARAKEEHGRKLLAQHFISADDYTQLKTNLDTAAAAVAQDKANVDEAKLQLSYATVRAPVTGKLGHIAETVGNTVHAAAQTTLTTLNVLDTVDVTFAIPEQRLGALRTALRTSPPMVEARVDTASAQQPDKVMGRLTFINNAADPATGTIQLRARFDNRARVLWPGQFVTVSLALGGKQPATVVPAAAIRHGPDGTYVFVVDKGATVSQVAVKVQRTTTRFAILTGVKPGEQVVVDGQSRLTPGAHVAVRLSGRKT